MKSLLESATETGSRLGIKPADRCHVVSKSRQTMQFFRQGECVKTYVISTSLRPPSNVKNSLGTPCGLHAIAERIGGGQPPGIVFKSRVPTGYHFNELPDASTHPNLITSRILWLRGLEPGVNQGGEVDTYERYVYIHGTNHEDRLGTPQSAGCVLMNNLEIIALYEDMRAGDWVWIGV
jgi:hypothetical protein